MASSPARSTQSNRQVPGAAVMGWRGTTNQRQFAGPFDADRGVRAWCQYGRAWIARGACQAFIGPRD